MSNDKLRGKVVLNRDSIPYIELPDGNLMPPTIALYQIFNSRTVNGAQDGNFRAFQSGYLKQKRFYGLRDALRSLVDPVFAHGMNRVMRFYEAGLNARENLERKVGEVVEI